MSNRFKTTLIAATLTAAWGLSYAATLRVADVDALHAR